jgi:hypothetical protein
MEKKKKKSPYCVNTGTQSQRTGGRCAVVLYARPLREDRRVTREAEEGLLGFW